MVKQRSSIELRQNDRTPLSSKLSYAFFVNGKVEAVGGQGQLKNMSSSGVAFVAADDEVRKRLATGAGLQLEIDWEETDQVKLVVKGRVVRLDAGLVAIGISHYAWKSKRVRPVPHEEPVVV